MSLWIKKGWFKQTVDRMKAIVFFVLMILLITACGPTITFEQPQPAGVDSITNFPANLRGQYISSDKASILTISEDKIYRNYDYELKIAFNKDSLTDYKLIGDTLYDRSSGTAEYVRKEGDSITRHIQYTDSIFRISEFQVVKKYKGFFFLNDFLGADVWSVRKLGYSRGILSIAAISAVREIDELNKIAESPKDTLTYHFALSKKQFRKFLRNDGFRNEELFYRLR